MRVRSHFLSHAYTNHKTTPTRASNREDQIKIYYPNAPATHAYASGRVRPLFAAVHLQAKEY
jgi:hypothetical protein